MNEHGPSLLALKSSALLQTMPGGLHTRLCDILLD